MTGDTVNAQELAGLLREAARAYYKSHVECGAGCHVSPYTDDDEYCGAHADERVWTAAWLAGRGLRLDAPGPVSDAAIRGGLYAGAPTEVKPHLNTPGPAEAPSEPLDLNEIQALVDAATPGPWGWWRDPSLVEDGVYALVHPDTKYDADGKLVDACTVCRGMTGPNREANAQFIARARQIIPALLERARSVSRDAPGEPSNEQLRELLDFVRGPGGGWKIPVDVDELRGVWPRIFGRAVEGQVSRETEEHE